MKITSIILNFSFFFLPILMNGQTFPIDEETKRIKYEEVVQVEGISSKELFDRTVEFFKTEYLTDNFKLSDTLNSTISNDGSLLMQYVVMKYNMENIILYTLTVKIKEGRYKYTIDNFRLSSATESGSYEQSLMSVYNGPSIGAMKKLKKALDAELNNKVHEITTRLKTALATGEIKKEDDNW